MSVLQYMEGRSAECGSCGAGSTVQTVGIHDGGVAFNMGCGHRNGYCEACDILVPDATHETNIVTARCPFCSG